MRVLAVSGSLRPGSHNSTLLQAAARRLPTTAEMVLWERLSELPAYAEHLDGPDAPVVVADLRRTLTGSDAVLKPTAAIGASTGLFVTGSDAVVIATEKPTAAIGASTDLFGEIWAQAETRKVLSAIGARVVDDDLPVGQVDEALGADGDLTAPELRRRLDDVVAALREACVPLSRAAA